MTSGPWRVATRRSALARAQAAQFARQIEVASGRPAELVPMATTGDEQPDRAIEAFDSKGLFVDRTRQAVLSGDCDFVVHSYKDLPTDPSDGLTVGAVPQRVDPRDALISREGWRLPEIPRDRMITIGTSSARRRAQLQRHRRDLIIQPLRGNLDTRIEKVTGGELHAVVVAMAGLLRLQPRADARVMPLENGEMLPAPAQGALAIECRADDELTLAALALVDDPESRRCVTAERSFLATLQGGCTAPIGAFAHLVTVDGHPRLELLGLLADPSGTRLVRASAQAATDEPELLGQTLAGQIAAEGAEILERLRG